MNNHNTAVSQGGGPSPQGGNPLPCRETVSNFQFETLFTALDTLRPYLVTHPVEVDLPKLDGGVAAAAVATFSRICDRMDAMLADNERWALRQNDELYSAISEHYREAANVSKSAQRPSHIFRPDFTIINGEYIAMWGNPRLPGGVIIGKGKTPTEALADFDSAFARKTEEQYRLAPASEERLKAQVPVPDVTVKEVPAKKPRKKKY